MNAQNQIQHSHQAELARADSEESAGLKAIDHSQTSRPIMLIDLMMIIDNQFILM